MVKLKQLWYLNDLEILRSERNESHRSKTQQKGHGSIQMDMKWRKEQKLSNKICVTVVYRLINNGLELTTQAVCLSS